MVISRRAAVGSIVTGSAMLCLALFAVICGAIQLHMLSVHDTFNDSVGLWSLFCAVPGILSIMAGIKKHGGLMRLALFFNILALILSGAASIILFLLLALLHLQFNPEECGKFDTVPDHCGCREVSFEVSCGDVPTLRLIFVTTLVVYIFLTLTAFSASIFGCSSTCCAPILMDDPEDMSSGLSMLPDTSYQVTCRVMW